MFMFTRVNIGSRNGGGFNSIPQNGTERVSRFKRLLEGEMGQKLCKMYATYWQPAGMARNLEETAQYAKNHKSTISITDSVSYTKCVVTVKFSILNSKEIYYT